MTILYSVLYSVEFDRKLKTLFFVFLYNFASIEMENAQMRKVEFSSEVIGILQRFQSRIVTKNIKPMVVDKRNPSTNSW